MALLPPLSHVHSLVVLRYHPVLGSELKNSEGVDTFPDGSDPLKEEEGLKMPMALTLNRNIRMGRGGGDNANSLFRADTGSNLYTATRCELKACTVVDARRTLKANI